MKNLLEKLNLRWKKVSFSVKREQKFQRIQMRVEIHHILHKETL